MVSRTYLKKLNPLLILSLCCLLAYFLLPPSYRHYIITLRKYSLLLELALLFYLLLSIRKLRKHYHTLQAEFPDTAFNTRDSITHILGQRMLYRFLATELVILRYGIKLWGSEKQPLENYRSYTVYKESGYLTVWIAFTVVIIIETIAVHFLLLKWSSAAAIGMTVLSVYGLFFFISDLNAIIKRPILINDSTVILRVGYRWRCILPLENILSLEMISGDHLTAEGSYVGSIIKSSSNIRITVKAPVRMERFMKSSLIVSSIIINIDQHREFAEIINTTIDKMTVAPVS